MIVEAVEIERIDDQVRILPNANLGQLGRVPEKDRAKPNSLSVLIDYILINLINVTI